jgi:hypothetical protein
MLEQFYYFAMVRCHSHRAPDEVSQKAHFRTDLQLSDPFFLDHVFALQRVAIQPQIVHPGHARDAPEVAMEFP